MTQTELTVTQTMKRLNVANRTVHNMIADGRLTARRVDAPVPYYLITLDSIERLEAQVKAKRDQSPN